jgi:hypothetical protein
MGTSSPMFEPRVATFFNNPNTNTLEHDGLLKDKLDTTTNEGYDNFVNFVKLIKLTKLYNKWGEEQGLNVPSSINKDEFRKKVTEYFSKKSARDKEGMSRTEMLDEIAEESEFAAIPEISQNRADEYFIPINKPEAYFDNAYEQVAAEKGLELHPDYVTNTLEWNTFKQGYQLSKKLDPNSETINKKQLYRDIPLKTIVFLTEKMMRSMRNGQSLFTIPGMIGVGAMMQEQGRENGNTR